MASHHARTPLHNYHLYFLSFLALSRLVSAQTENYIIHMDLSTMPKAFANHHSWYSATLATLSKTVPKTISLDLSSKLIYSYTHVINGFSASLTPSELEAVKGSPGYISSMRDLPVKVDTTHSFKFLGLNSNSGAWRESNYGENVIIGLVDTGVWPESASFNDDGMSEIPSRWKGECETGTQFNSSLCNKKLIGARIFNKGLLAKYPNTTIAMNSTRDTSGHGTHTSTTAAGNFVDGASYFGYASGTARGVAPRAHVAMYKALWEEGGYTSDIIAAIDQAINDGVDVLSLSFGLDGVPLYKDPVAIATFSALEKGVFVSTSAGNEGPFYGSLHNGIPWVLTVAAGTLDRDFYGVLNLGNGVSISGASLYPGNFMKTRVPIVFMGSCKNPKKLKKIGRKIVVCQDKNVDTLSTQYGNLEDAKVFGGVFITNNTDLEEFVQSSYPAIFVSPEDGEALKNYIKADAQPKAMMSFRNTVLGTKPAPKATLYTSRGPSPSCPAILKPDIMAPGSLILAAWPANTSATEADGRPLYSQFNLLSGTSMACPHAAGVAALVLGARPEWGPAAIRSALMTSSDVYDNTLSPIKDIGFNNQPATPLAIGSGHINPNKALDPGLIYDVEIQDYVNVLCALNYTVEHIKVITKSSSLVDCSKPSLDLNYPSFIAFFNANDSKSDAKTVKDFQRTVTNVGEGKSTYIASVTSMEGLKVNVVPKKLVFKEKNEKKKFKLSIEGPRMMKQRVVFGYLTWVDNDNKHVVRSPIVATNLDSTAVS
ncbi:Subtilisin-like protease [Morus notabilis]|uniref:Subtilisin-like protease n=1 Tax=Morus notabilis TaxID=981085 RepID=W9SHY0_9ROSA|nr:subtilisin-like protease SBT1.9 [Morus notabilis]EXC32843.1 Subtilisin-like protease [Morus notabilis]